MSASQLDQRPLMVAVTGPNGAGKTTFYHAHLKPAGLRWVNADVLAAELDMDPYGPVIDAGVDVDEEHAGGHTAHALCGGSGGDRDQNGNHGGRAIFLPSKTFERWQPRDWGELAWRLRRFRRLASRALFCLSDSRCAFLGN